MSICQSCYMDFSKLLQVFLPLLLLALAGGQEHQLDEEQDDELVNIITMMQNGFRCLDVTINNAYMLMSLLFTFLSPQKSFTYFLSLRNKSMLILTLIIMQFAFCNSLGHY